MSKAKPKKVKAQSNWPRADFGHSNYGLEPIPNTYNPVRYSKNHNTGNQITPDILNEVLMRICDGEPLYQICQLPHMPDRVHFYRFMCRNEEFRSDYKLAREYQTESYMDRLIMMSQAVWENPDINPHAARVAMDGMRFCIEKLNPATYGPKAKTLELVDKRPQLLHWLPAQKTEHTLDNAAPITINESDASPGSH